MVTVYMAPGVTLKVFVAKAPPPPPDSLPPPVPPPPPPPQPWTVRFVTPAGTVKVVLLVMVCCEPLVI